MEKCFEKNKEVLSLAFTAIGDAVILIDKNRNIGFMNKEAERMTDFNICEAINKSIEKIFKIYNEDEGEIVHELINSAIVIKNPIGLKKGTYLISKKGTKHFISANLSCVYDENKDFIGLVIVFRDITNIKKIEEDFITERNNYINIFENMPLGIVLVDKDIQVQQMNNSFVNMFNVNKKKIGYCIGEVINCPNSFAMGCGKSLECGTCELRKSVDKVIKDIKNQNDGIIEIKYIDEEKKNIENILVKLRFSSVKIENEDLMMLIMEDVTKEVILEENATKNEKKYKSLFMNMDTYFIYFEGVFDENGNPISSVIDTVNDSFQKAINLPIEEIIGKSIDDVFRLDKNFLLSNRNEIYGELIKGNSVDINNLYVHSLHKWCDLAIYSPEPGKVALLINDVDEKKKINMELIKARDEAEAANKAKSEFLANMSHEIRTPLNGIQGMIDLTLLTELSKDQKDNLFTAKMCIGTLLNIINDILDFSKLEAGKFNIIYKAMNLKLAVEEVVKSNLIALKRKGLKFIVDIDEKIPEYIVGDKNRIKQILNNLVSNSIKFTHKGTVTIEIKMISENKTNIELKFSVIDTGIGISEVDISKLFKSFSQIDGSYTRKYGGTGLGLVITKQLVEIMGGSIYLESEKHKGSKFYFIMKFNLPDLKTVDDTLVSQMKISSKNELFLIVEDDNISKRVLYKMLLEKGYKVDCATNGLEALELYKNKKYDLILMDINMPKMDGVEAVKAIRKLEKENDRKHTPIIAITAFALMGDREKFLESGMDDYVPKPISLEILYETIEKNIYAGEYTREVNSIINQTSNYTAEFESKLNDIDKQNIGDMIKIIKIAILDEDDTQLEISAHNLKLEFQKMSIENVKNYAFKMEMAARKSNFKQAEEYLFKIEKILKDL
jgi:PAS domain S-box-containing protein